jgi:UDP-2,4-diacetamido-2,4,6-trideoxy-beta-L-altropyranose hydrolase
MNRVVTLRKGEEQDCHDLYLWRNDEESRRNSKNPNIIPWENHCRWFAAVLSDHDRALHIGLDRDSKIGMVRFDRVDEDHFIVSITLNPKCRGSGHAKLLLELALRQTHARFIDAEIRDGNEKSRRLFTSCGFGKIGRAESNGFSLYRKLVGADDP